MENALPIEELSALAAEFGLRTIGAAALELPDAGRRLALWQERGYAAELAYMRGRPERAASVLNDYPWVKGLLCCAVRYSAAPLPERPSGFARVARYAWGRDYHNVLRRRLQKFLKVIQQRSNGRVTGAIRVDATPLLERAFAESAGLGFVGRNTLLIRPGIGSYFLLGELLLSAPISAPAPEPPKAGCGGCRRCLPACPTGALVDSHTLDAARCISYLTIEKRGAFSLQERAALGEWAFGCDICQEACPFNSAPRKRAEPPEIDHFLPGQGAGPLLDLESVLKIRTDDQFSRRYAGTPLARPRRAGLLRNCATVAVNTGSEVALPALKEALDDSDELVRQHALWAYSRLTGHVPGKSPTTAAIERALSDPHPMVRAEALALTAGEAER